VAEAAPDGVFVSYRREDAPGHAGRLYDYLTASLGKDRVFMDVDAIAPGADFVERIDAAILRSQAMLVVIGPGWVTATDREGHRRLDDPHDVVRHEISSALDQQLLVVPVLVSGAVMPAQEQLPDGLAGLAARNAFYVDDVRWAADIDRLLAALASRDVVACRVCGFECEPDFQFCPACAAPLATRLRGLGQANAFWLPLLLFGVLVCASATLFFFQDLESQLDTIYRVGDRVNTDAAQSIDSFSRTSIDRYWTFALFAGSVGTAAWYAWTARYAGIRTRARGAVATWIIGGLLLRAPPVTIGAMWRLDGNGNAVLLAIAAGLLVLSWTSRSRLLASISVIFLAVSSLCVFYNPENLLPAMTIGDSSALHVLLPGVVLLMGAATAWWLSSRRRLVSVDHANPDSPAAGQPPP
jgi:hypothetical protein